MITEKRQNFQAIIWCFCLIFCTGLLLFLCLHLSSGGAYANKKDGEIGKTEKKDHGDRIIFGSIGEASNLIPYLSSDSASHEVAGLLYVAPLRYDKDLNVECYAAEWYKIEDEGKLLRFRLRPHILWEDGEELTAYDMEYTWKVVTDPKTASPYAEDFLRVKEFRVLDRYTFEVTYEEFYVRALTSWMSAILPKHILEKQDIRHTPYARHPVGAGPYRLKEWKTGSAVTLEASPTYFLGRPSLDEVVFRIIPDQATMFMETRAHRLDVTDLTPLQYLRETDGPMWTDTYAKYRYLASMYVFMGFNLEHPFFKNVLVRQAISKAISREEIVRGCLLGQGIAAFGPYIPGSWAYHPHLSAVKRNVNEAIELLHMAGFKDSDKDGVLDRDGHPFRFTILTNQGNEQRILVSLLIQYQLKQIGIDVKIRTVEWAAFIREFVNKGHFDAVILGWTVSQDPDVYQIWHSSQAHDGGLNFVHYRNPEADRLLEEARSTPDQEKRKQLYYKFQEELYRDTPYCFLFVPYSLPLIHKRFHGIQPALAGIMYNFEDWWVPKNEQKYHVLHE